MRSSSGWPRGTLLLAGEWASRGDLLSGAEGCVSPAGPRSSFGLGLGGAETLSPSPWPTGLTSLPLTCLPPVFL